MLYLGIDGGGTKCRAVIENQNGEIIGRGIGGPANPLHGFQRAINSILEATGQAIEETGLSEADYPKIIAGIGLAGVNLSSLYQKIYEWKHPFAKMDLTTDLDIANIGAHNGEDGAVIIVGTGSCGFVSTNQHKITYGGHGFPIGDKASGAWMGLKAVEYTLLALDGFENESLLTEKVCEYFSADSAIALSEVLAGRASWQFAKIASLVLAAADAGDSFAESVVRDATGYISQLADKLLDNNPKRLSMIGGLSDFIIPLLAQPLAEQFVEPLQPPEIGALLFAKQSWIESQVESA